MANATEERLIDAVGSHGPWLFDLPVDGGSNIFKGTLVTQLTATAQLVPYSTAAAGKCVGVAQHDALNLSGADGDIRCLVETGRVYIFDNGAGGDAFAEGVNLIGSAVYGTDDHTVADNSNTQTRQIVGFYMGMEPDGRVRVYVVPWAQGIASASFNPA